MLLHEILYEAARDPGYWKVTREGERRIWTPSLQGQCLKFEPDHDYFCLPSKYSNFRPVQNQRSSMKLGGKSIPFYQSQAFKLWGTPRESTPKDVRRLIEEGLSDALKLRSATDVIDNANFQMLLNTSVGMALGGIPGLTRQSSKRIVIVSPESSSSVAGDFARGVAQRLGVPDNQVFIGHVRKRELMDIYDDMYASEALSQKDKEAIEKRITDWMGDDEKFKMKDLWHGHRTVLHKAGIDMFDVHQPMEFHANEIPWLVIADDNIVTNVTAKSVAQKVASMGVTFHNVASVAMYNYQTSRR